MLKEKLLQDFKDAMKEKNELKKNTVMMVRAAVLQIEKDTQKEVLDDQILEIIAKEVKKRKESLADYEKSGREDLIRQINDEIAILKGYLPEELSEEEIRKIVEERIKETGATTIKDMGKVMQMAKTTSAISKLNEAGLLYISVLTDPTYGGVTASFASIADIILAEPGAMIGFAGQRVIEQTIGEKLPEGFQTAEFLLEHGFIDKIVERKDLKNTLSNLIQLNK